MRVCRLWVQEEESVWRRRRVSWTLRVSRCLYRRVQQRYLIYCLDGRRRVTWFAYSCRVCCEEVQAQSALLRASQELSRQTAARESVGSLFVQPYVSAKSTCVSEGGAPPQGRGVELGCPGAHCTGWMRRGLLQKNPTRRRKSRNGNHLMRLYLSWRHRSRNEQTI